MSDSEDPRDLQEEEGDDLFGDESDKDASPAPQFLSDRDLDSDQDRHIEEAGDGYGSEAGAPLHEDKVIAAYQLSRHRTPKSQSGTIESLKVPPFLHFNPEAYDAKTFEPTEWDVSNARSEKPKLAIRYYNDPETGELKSNAAIHRWSDGSASISVGDQHFALQKKDTVPPPGKPYNELQDAHTYAAAAHNTIGLFSIVGHVGAEYTVRLNKSLEDDALRQLAMRMREARSKDEASRIIKTTHDPELQRKQAELAEKERAKAQRRRENAAARAEGAGSRYGRGGLSIDDLEGSRRGAAGGRKRGAAGGKGRRRRPEYDSDDDRPDGARRQEDYDMEDDFIAPSDDEGEEEVEDEEEEEELLDDDDDDEDEPQRKRQKKSRAAGDDRDADGEVDDEVQATGRSRRRNIIDDDDED